MTDHKTHPNYFLVWIWLMILVTFSILVGLILPKSIALLLIFAAATIKAILVALNFMHLKYEKPLLYAIAIVPVLIVIILIFALFPDFVFRS